MAKTSDSWNKDERDFERMNEMNILTRKQLEDASKCTKFKSCSECSCKVEAGRYLCEEESAQTALTLLDMLKKLEWTLHAEDEVFCPRCGNSKTDGHEYDCQLGNLLKEVD